MQKICANFLRKDKLFFTFHHHFRMKTIRVRGSTEAIPVGKILCLGRNYSEHAKEMRTEIPDRPVVFIKPSTAIICDGEDICIPKISHELHHEVELVVAISETGKHIPRDRTKEHILGYSVGLDMTLRDVQAEAKNKGLPWSVAKGFDTSAPVSEFIPTSMIRNLTELEIRCKVNGKLRQSSRLSQMIFSVEETIAYVSALFTLERGDLIFTGTPAGVGKVDTGDRIEAELVGWTTITHAVKSEQFSY
jgi:acylpyruvate hydrolase